MPLLQESQAGRGFNKIKQVESDDSLPMSTGPTFPGLHTNSLLTPTQLLAASQTAALMAASAGLPVSLHATLSSNASLFHPGLFGPMWPPTSPQSPPSGPGSPLSPNSKVRKNNNNNVVSSSSGEHVLKASLERRKTVRKLQEIVDRSPPTVTDIVATSGQLSPPTSGSSPPSSTSEPASIKEPNRDKQFVCGVCNRSFGYKHVLQNHERTHTGEKPFECPECHKRFTRDHHLKTHMRLHTGERPYHCDHCDRHFVQVANLRRHLRVHTGERPYNCKECSARFSDSNQLKAHVLIHKGEKPFHCDRCQGRFRRRHHLMHHKCGMLAGGGGGGGSTTTSLISSPELSSGIDMSSSEIQTVAINCTQDTTDTRTTVVDDYHDDECPEDLSGHKEKNRDKKSSHDIRRMIRMPSVTPLITLPLHVSLPEQTEPEDLSMNARHNHSQHSHGSSSHSVSPPLSSRSPCSDDHQDMDENEDDDELDEAATLFLKRHPHRRQDTNQTHPNS